MHEPPPSPAHPKVSRRRRWRLAIVVALAVLCGLIAGSPVWVPWLTPTLVRAFGATVERCERVGLWRLACAGVRFEAGSVRLEARRVEVLQPVGYAVEWLVPTSLASTNAPGVLITDWEVVVGADEQGSGAGEGSASEILNQVAGTLRQMQHALPAARLVGGRLQVAGEEVRLPEVTWDAGAIHALVESARLTQPVRLDAGISPAGGITLQLEADVGKARVEIERAATGPGWSVALEAQGFENEARGEALLSDTGWLPERATLRIEPLRWPETVAARPPPLRDVGGALSLDWRDGRARLDFQATAELALPALPQTVAAKIEIAAETDLTQASVSRLSIVSEPLQIELAEPVHLVLTNLDAAPRVRLGVVLDLARLAPGTVEGEFAGEIAADLRSAVRPRATFDFEGRGVAFEGSRVERLALGGQLEWPRLEVTTARVEWGTSRFEAAGQADLAAQALEELRWTIEGLPPWPGAEAVSLGGLRASGRVSGAFPQPQHEGTIEARDVRVGGLEPLTARVGWRGVGAAFDGLNVNLSAGSLVWDLAGKARLSGDQASRTEIEVNRFVWTRDGVERGRLQQAAQIGLGLGPRAAGPREEGGSEVNLSPLVVEGPQLRVALAGKVQWPALGHVQLDVIRLPLADFEELIPGIPTSIAVDAFSAVAGWTNGPATGRVQCLLTAPSVAGSDARLTADLQLTETGLSLEGEVLRGADQPVARLQAELPVRVLVPGGEPFVRLDAHAPLRVNAEATQQQEIWDSLASRFGVAVREPALSVNVTGTANRLQGNARFQAASVASENALSGLKIPVVEKLALDLTLAEEGRARAEAAFEVAGQQATGHLELPIESPSLDRLARLRAPTLASAEGELRLRRWSLEPLAPWLPEPLLPVGGLDLDLRLRPGLELEGSLAVTNVGTQPLPSLGPIRGVSFVSRVGREGLTLTDGAAELGGRAIVFAGGYRFATNVTPRLSASLAGTNLALARSSDVLLRGDARLELKGDSLDTVTVAGEVELRDSLLLRELQSLVAGGVQQPETRPPYFSVRAEPFGSWRLDVRVAGDRFLRVVTPVFRGWVSTSLQVAGTLREPVAVGDVTVPEGRLTFPFGSLKVDQARVSLTREDPFRPRLQVRASGRNFGYDLRLDASGPADAANVVFGSVPPLSSTQVLLMLTTGDIPSEAYSYSTGGKLQTIGLYLGKQFLGQLAGDSGSDRLTMRTGEEVTDRGQLTYRIEYRLTPKWSLFGIQDRFDTYLGGVTYNLYEK